MKAFQGLRCGPPTAAAPARESQGRFKAEAFLFMYPLAAPVAHESQLGCGYGTLSVAAAPSQGGATGGPIAGQGRWPAWLAVCTPMANA